MTINEIKLTPGIQAADFNALVFFSLYFDKLLVQCQPV